MEKGKIFMAVQSDSYQDYSKKLKALNFHGDKSRQVFSLNKIAKEYGIDADWALNEWLSSPVTLEYIEVWESMHNICLDNEKFVRICHNALKKHRRPSVKALNLDAFVKSVYYDGQTGQIMLNKDMAIDFTCWISPSFKCYLNTALKDVGLLAGQPVLDGLNKEEDFHVTSIQLASYLKHRAKRKIKNRNTASTLPFNIRKYEYYAGS